MVHIMCRPSAQNTKHVKGKICTHVIFRKFGSRIVACLLRFLTTLAKFLGHLPTPALVDIYEGISLLLHIKKICIVYSLISIRQNYYFDVLGTVWHEIVSWFLTISQDFCNMISAEQFDDRNKQEWGKKQKSTNNANDGSSIKMIDGSHGD